jgi:hypothetical protein
MPLGGPRQSVIGSPWQKSRDPRDFCHGLLALLEEGSRIASETLPAGHWRRDDADLALAAALAATGDLVRARALAGAVAERLESQTGLRAERLQRELAALMASGQK